MRGILLGLATVLKLFFWGFCAWTIAHAMTVWFAVQDLPGQAQLAGGLIALLGVLGAWRASDVVASRLAARETVDAPWTMVFAGAMGVLFVVGCAHALIAGQRLMTDTDLSVLVGGIFVAGVLLSAADTYFRQARHCAGRGEE